MLHNMIREIIVSKTGEVLMAESVLNEEAIMKQAQEYQRDVRSLKDAIKGKDKLSLIAEVKRASPSAGVIREKFRPIEIARIYEQNGASAISVLTEKEHFQGSLGHMRAVREQVKLPVLRKDFIFDIYQVYESYLAGADGVLLIARIVPPAILNKLHNVVKSLGMQAIIEVHDEKELDDALKADAEIIGINNRDLNDFTVDIKVTDRLASRVPVDKVIVSESGIKTKEDIEFLKSLSIDAVLVGESFLREDDMAAAIKKIFSS